MNEVQIQFYKISVYMKANYITENMKSISYYGKNVTIIVRIFSIIIFTLSMTRTFIRHTEKWAGLVYPCKTNVIRLVLENTNAHNIRDKTQKCCLISNWFYKYNFNWVFFIWLPKIGSSYLSLDLMNRE